MKGKNLVCFDFGVKTSKLVRVHKGEVTKRVSFPTPLSVINDGSVVDVEKLAVDIKRIMKEHKIKAKNMAVALDSSTTIVRNFELPYLQPEEIRPALELQMSETLQNILQSHVMSYRVFRSDLDKIQGVVALAPTDVVMSYMELAALLGLTLEIVDVTPNCTAKYYNQFIMDELNVKNAVIVDVGYHAVHADLVVGDILTFTRRLQGGVHAIDQVIVEKYAVDLKEAERIRLGKSDEITLTEDEYKSVVRLGCLALDDLVRQTLDYFKYNNQNSKIDAFILHGNGIRMKAIQEFFDVSYGQRVHIVESENLGYVNAIGSAIRED